MAQAVIAQTTAQTEIDESLEYSVKAAFVSKFGAFVEWPDGTFPDPNAPINIGLLGDDPFGAHIDQIIAGRNLPGRPIQVSHLRRVDQAKEMQILFISNSEKSRMEIITAGLRGRSVLTVADFYDPAVIITFVIAENKVRFDINLEQAQRNNLKLSSKLLSVALHVTGTAKP